MGIWKKRETNKLSRKVAAILFVSVLAMGTVLTGFATKKMSAQKERETASVIGEPNPSEASNLLVEETESTTVSSLDLFNGSRDLSTPYLNTEEGKWLVLDVDMSTDVDDVCAVRMATALDDMGIVELKAVNYCISSGNTNAMRGLLLHDGCEDVLIGTGMEQREDESPYWSVLEAYSDGQGDVDTAVAQYRRVLAEAKTPVDIVVTGQMVNLEHLLKSEGDSHSPLPGRELVKSKVGQLYIVGGSYPEGWSNNFALTSEAVEATRYVFENWGLPIVVSPGQTGGKLVCGKYLQQSDVNQFDPVTKSLYAFGTSEGRAAWDPFGVWVCGYGCSEVNQVSFTQTRFGIADNGGGWFIEDENGGVFVLHLANEDLNYYNQTMDNHLIYLYEKLYNSHPQQLAANEQLK